MTSTAREAWQAAAVYGGRLGFSRTLQVWDCNGHASLGRTSVSLDCCPMLCLLHFPTFSVRIPFFWALSRIFGGTFPLFLRTDETTWQKNAHGCVGLDYTADMNPMFGGGDRPRGPGGDLIAWPDRRFQKGAEAGNLGPCSRRRSGPGPRIALFRRWAALTQVRTVITAPGRPQPRRGPRRTTLGTLRVGIPGGTLIQARTVITAGSAPRLCKPGTLSIWFWALSHLFRPLSILSGHFPASSCPRSAHQHNLTTTTPA